MSALKITDQMLHHRDIWIRGSWFSLHHLHADVWAIYEHASSPDRDEDEHRLWHAGGNIALSIGEMDELTAALAKAKEMQP